MGNKFILFWFNTSLKKKKFSWGDIELDVPMKTFIDFSIVE